MTSRLTDRLSTRSANGSAIASTITALGGGAVSKSPATTKSSVTGAASASARYGSIGSLRAREARLYVTAPTADPFAVAVVNATVYVPDASQTVPVASGRPAAATDVNTMCPAASNTVTRTAVVAVADPPVADRA